MTINYQVQAQVVDIRSDLPTRDDLFLVDTNVWYWVSYSKASQGPFPSIPYQVREYPRYIQRAVKEEARVVRCTLTFPELANVIEKKERKIHLWDVSDKQFRHNMQSERAIVASEIATAWRQVCAMSDPMSFSLDDGASRRALDLFQHAPIGGYDLLLVEAASQLGTPSIVTDDGDFCTVAGITVFTANREVIVAASSQGHLQVR